MVNHSSHTPDSGKWTRHYNLAQNLAQQGWRTRVITASVDRHGVEQPLHPGEGFRHQEFDGFSFTYLRTPEYRGHGIGRIWNIMSFMFKAIGKAPHHGIPAPDVVVGCTVHPFAALAGAVLAKRYGVPFFFEVRDLWPETLIQLGLTRRGSIPAKVLGALERYLYGRADRIISTLPNIGKYLEKNGISSENVRWITNGIDFSTLPEYAVPNEEDAFRILYIGSLAYSYGLETLIEAMALVQDRANGPKSVELDLVGDGELRQELEARVEELGLKNIHFRGAVTRQEVPLLATKADAFVILVRDLPDLYCYGISMNKLTEYLAIGRPIIISVGDGVNNMVAEARAGLTVSPEQPEALAEAIIELVGMPRDEQLKMGQRGREFAKENLDYSYLAQKYVKVLAEVMDP